MPSIKAYTQYETLAFCQSVARHGSDTTAFEDISTALNDNQLIRESETYDQTRLTAHALQTLYHDLLAEEKSAQSSLAVNADDGLTNGTNPRKRKLSTSPAPPDDAQSNEQKLLQSLVDRLYARFKEQIIKEIRQEEEDYLKVQLEIAQLEQKEVDEQVRQTATAKVDSTVPPQRLAPNTTEISVPKGSIVHSPPKPGPGPATPGFEGNRLERAASTATPPVFAAPSSPNLIRTNVRQPVATSHPPAPGGPTVSPARRSVELQQARPPLPPLAQPPQRSPGTYPASLPVPSPQRPNYGPIHPQHYQHGPQGLPVPVLPQYPGIPHMPPPAEYPPKRTSSSPAQGRGSASPMPPQLQPQQQPYPGYTGYPQQPPWPHQLPAQHQYGHPQQFSPQPYYVQSPPGRPVMPQFQTPHHPVYAPPYPQSAPIHYQGQTPPHAWPQPQPQPGPGQLHYGYPGSANVTPVPRSNSRPVPIRARSSTPWKRRAPPPNGVRPPSPTRPQREVSPISDTESPTRAKTTKKSPTKPEAKQQVARRTSREPGPSARGRQQASATPSAFVGSRSQSLASFASDAPGDSRKRGGQKIKAEPSSTPAPIPSDTEPQAQDQTTGRRGRPRGSTLASKTDNVVAGTANKRKRSVGRDSATPPPSIHRQEPSPATSATTRLQPDPLSGQLSHSLLHDPSFVTVTRNFSKTAQLLLNEISSHRLAGIFAKPLSERDAPGYRDLVLRPQDLKSIKTAISKGGKAALAAMEGFEERSDKSNAGEEDGEDEKTPTGKELSTTTAIDVKAGEKMLGNGVFLVKANEDLLPPKGIVNSAQLEMELVRMFANAVMFNPLPSSERGFGRSLRLRKRGGDVGRRARGAEDEDDERTESSESDEGTPAEEGGIISDTRQMFEDVMGMVRKWREVEIERLGNVGDAELMASNTPMAGSRKLSAQHLSAQGSTSVSANPSLRHSESVEVEDDTAGPSTPATMSATGTARKRRRVADASAK